MTQKTPPSKRINLLRRAPSTPGAEAPGVSTRLLSGAIVAVLVSLSYMALSQQRTLGRIRTERAEMAMKLEEVSQKLQQLNSSKANLQVQSSQLVTLRQIQARKVQWAELFKELSLLVGRDTWVSSLKASAASGKRNMTLEGTGETPQSVSDLYESLELSPHFKRVMLVSSAIDEKTNPPLYRYQFEIPVDAPSTATDSGSKEAGP